MKKVVALALLLAVTLTIALSACGSSTDSQKSETDASESGSTSPSATPGVYQKITPEAAKKMMDDDEVLVIDVRTQKEYSSSHIENAVLIQGKKLSKLPNKEAKILVYSSTDKQSAEAAHKLISLGYINVYDFGSINDWPYNIVELEKKT